MYDEWPEPPQEEASNSEDMLYQEEIDDFPDYKFETLWQQKCWDILYQLYFDIDSGAFLQDISEEAMGHDFFTDYINTIEVPINFLMIKKKMTKYLYGSQFDFVADMNLVFDNCMEYNQRSSTFYKAASKMKRKFKNMLKEVGLI